jgi:hypothetical protein
MTEPNHTTSADGLEREIAILRQMLAQVAAMCDAPSGNRSLAEMLRVLDILSMASTRLATLLKAQQTLGHDWGARFEEVLAEVIEEVRSPSPPVTGGRRRVSRNPAKTQSRHKDA